MLLWQMCQPLLSRYNCWGDAVVGGSGVGLGIGLTTPYTPASGGHSYFSFASLRKIRERCGYTVAD
jgi:hypothetical protein